MGMQQKLKKAFDEGFAAGQNAEQPIIELRGIVKGSQETWDLMEKMFLEIEGVGPKTKEKILKAIKDYAAKEKARYKAGV